MQAAETPDAGATRCGIDTVDIARIERMLAASPADAPPRMFTMQELADSGTGAGRSASLAARFAAKEACAKLFPRELALGQIEPEDFSVARDAYGAPQIVCNARAQSLLDRHRIRSIAISLTHDQTTASAVALALPAQTDAPFAGKVLYRVLPFRRRVIMDNLRRVFGAAVPAAEIERLAQAHYAHLWRLFGEFLRFRWMSKARKTAIVRVENVDAVTAALAVGKGVLVLTGHFGNFEVATIAGLAHFPQMHGAHSFRAPRDQAALARRARQSPI